MDIIAILMLMHISGVGHAAINRLLHKMKGQQLTPCALLELSPQDISHQFGLRPEVAEDFFTHRDQAQQTSEDLEHHEINILHNEHTDFPERLKNILGDSAPPVLFVRGNTSLLKQKALTVIGVRDHSEQGMNATRKNVETIIKQKNIVIISGNAAGIDAFAHQTALQSNGATIFVLPHGILHFHTKKWMVDCLTDQNHLILSEFPPQLPWITHAAMQRNRTLCALSQAVLLIETKTSGGSFSTAQNALKLKIPLFAIDYDPTPPSAEGNRLFLNKGALPIKENNSDLTQLFDVFDNSLKTSQLHQEPRLFDD
jgi:DNA protecting protein DprA